MNTTTTPASAAIVPPALSSNKNSAAAVMNAATARIIRALVKGLAPSRCGIAMAVENPGGHVVSAAVESSSSQERDGTRSSPWIANDVAAPTYDMESGSSPGPAPLVIAITRANAATPNASASAIVPP